MDKGEIVEQGPPETFFANPTNERTRTFLARSCIIERGRPILPPPQPSPASGEGGGGRRRRGAAKQRMVAVPRNGFPLQPAGGGIGRGNDRANREAMGTSRTDHVSYNCRLTKPPKDPP